MPDPSYAGYAIVARIKTGESSFSTVLTAPTISGLKEGFSNRASELDHDSPEDTQEESLISLSDLGRGVWHFYKQLNSYYELSSMTDAVKSIMPSSFFDANILRTAENEFEVIDKIEEYNVYGVTEAQLSKLDRNIAKWNEIDAGFSKLPESILLSLVATFDSAFADFVRSILHARPQRYSGSDKTYSVSEIVALGSVDDLINKVITDEVDQLMNKSHTDQIEFFEKSFGISIKPTYDRWSNFIEIFERRNLVAHGSLRVNERYLKNCRSAGLVDIGQNAGDQLDVSAEYLTRSTDILIEFGILLAFSAWQKQVPSSVVDSFRTIVEISFSLLQDAHPQVAERIVDYALSVRAKGADDASVKMLVVNLAIAKKMQDEDVDIEKILRLTDWSAADMKFRFCIAALKGDLGEVCRLFGPMKSADLIDPVEIKEWPVFKWVREKNEFRSKYEEIYGEAWDTKKTVAEPSDRADAA